ncbi:MAG: septum formation initiator family protein [Polyangiaceae bacterium]
MLKRPRLPGLGPQGLGRRGLGRALVLQRILPISLLVVALVGAPVMIFSREGMPRLEAVEQELLTVERENAELEREIELLRARVTRLRDDPAAVERLARDELGLIRQSEVVFQFPE